jgi:hypothetical protein
MEPRVDESLEMLLDMIEIAKTSGLKRIKIGDIEVELSDYELVKLYAQSLPNQEQNLTNSNNVPNTPPLGNEAKDTSTTMTDTLPSINEDPDLYLSTF